MSSVLLWRGRAWIAENDGASGARAALRETLATLTEERRRTSGGVLAAITAERRRLLERLYTDDHADSAPVPCPTPAADRP